MLNGKEKHNLLDILKDKDTQITKNKDKTLTINYSISLEKKISIIDFNVAINEMEIKKAEQETEKIDQSKIDELKNFSNQYYPIKK